MQDRRLRFIDPQNSLANSHDRLRRNQPILLNQYYEGIFGEDQDEMSTVEGLVHGETAWPRRLRKLHHAH